MSPSYDPTLKTLVETSPADWLPLLGLPRKRVTVEDRRFRWDQFLTGMHGRGGFEQEGLVQLSWSVVVDIVCLGIIIWIASGLYMWWGLAGHRAWGWMAILAGARPNK